MECVDRVYDVIQVHVWVTGKNRLALIQGRKTISLYPTTRTSSFLIYGKLPYLRWRWS